MDEGSPEATVLWRLDVLARRETGQALVFGRNSQS